jgi:hypothetical protein
MDIERGEVIRINLNPISGREQSGNARPCLVISHTRYNTISKKLGYRLSPQPPFERGALVDRSVAPVDRNGIIKLAEEL